MIEIRTSIKDNMNTEKQETTQFIKSMTYAIAIFAALTIHVTTIQSTSFTNTILVFLIAGILGAMVEAFENIGNKKKLLIIAMSLFVAMLLATLYNTKSIDKFYLSEHMEPIRSFHCLASLSSAPYWTEKQRLECKFLKR